MTTSARSAFEVVYNLEVDGDRCFRVGPQGLLVHNSSMPDGMTRTTPAADKNQFHAEECGSPEFFIDGTLSGGAVTFTVVADVGGRRGMFSGRQFFNAMLDHFGIRRVKVISARWSDARPELKTNLDIFNQETRGGATKIDAAFATHTGKWSKGRGFEVVVNLDTVPADFPGGYEQVTVDFGRPPSPAKKLK